MDARTASSASRRSRLTEFFEYVLKLRDAKAIPSAEFTSQDMTASLDQSGMATGKVAMSFGWSNQLNAFSKASGQQLKLLRLPSSTGKAAKNGSYYKGSMFWSISSRSKHPKEAAKFVNFLANNTGRRRPPAGRAGRPAEHRDPRRRRPRSCSRPTPPRRSSSRSIGKELGEPSPAPPVGGGQVEKIIQRYTTEVLFGRLAPDKAAQQFLDEVNGELK